MEEDVIRVLATAAAGLIMRAMGTAAWRATRDRWARLLGRGNRESEVAVARQLDESAEAAATTNPVECPKHVDAVAADLQDLVHRRLRDDPELVGIVHAAVADAPADHDHSASRVRQAATVWNGTSIQSGRDTTIGPAR